MALTSSQLDGILAKIATLEASYRSDRATYFGTKAKNGGPWSGVGINQAKRLQQNLTQTPESDAAAKWAVAQSRINSIVS